MTVVLAARRLGLVGTMLLLSAAVGTALFRQPQDTRLITAVCIGVCGVVLAMQWPRTAVVTVLVLLPFLALFRRVLLDFTPWNSTDPLLLLAPAILAIAFTHLYVLERRSLTRDRMGKLVLFLVLFSFLQALNPGNGGLAAGGAALLFTAVPMCWYFVGRELGTPRALGALYAIGTASAAVIALYGLNQTWNGMPSWDRDWVTQTGYASLHVGDVIRAFGTFSSASEYATFLAIGIVVALAFALDRRPYLLPLTPLLGVALFYESSRTVLVTTSFTVVCLIAARTGNMRRATVTLALCFAALATAYVFGRGSLGHTAATSSNSLVSHQLGGLSDPFNAQQSTLPTHLAMLRDGFEHGVLDPFGHGIASINLAGHNLGSGSQSTEVDVSNVFVGYGTLGGFAYLAVVLLGLRSALRQAVRRHDAVSLAAFGIMLVVFGQWLNGGYYAVAPLVWFTVGFVVAQERFLRSADA